MNARWALVATFGLAVAMPLLAHHSVSQEFDSGAVVTLQGTVTKVDWTNPHVWVYVDVMGADGKVANWGIEAGTPKRLSDVGLDTRLVAPGQHVAVTAWAARNGSKKAGGRTLTLAGNRVFDIHDTWSDPQFNR